MLLTMIDAGFGDHPIPADKFVVGNSGTGVAMIARPLKKLWKTEVFTYSQVSQAVDLLQICGLNQGRNEEMWATVYVRKKQIGFINMGPLLTQVGNTTRADGTSNEI